MQSTRPWWTPIPHCIGCTPPSEFLRKERTVYFGDVHSHLCSQCLKLLPLAKSAIFQTLERTRIEREMVSEATSADHYVVSCRAAHRLRATDEQVNAISRAMGAAASMSPGTLRETINGILTENLRGKLLMSDQATRLIEERLQFPSQDYDSWIHAILRVMSDPFSDCSTHPKTGAMCYYLSGPLKHVSVHECVTNMYKNALDRVEMPFIDECRANDSEVQRMRRHLEAHRATRKRFWRLRMYAIVSASLLRIYEEVTHRPGHVGARCAQEEFHRVSAPPTMKGEEGQQRGTKRDLSMMMSLPAHAI